MDTDREVGIIGVGGRKGEMADGESAETWKSKKNKVSSFDEKIASLTIYIFIKKEKISMSSFVLGKNG